MADPELESPLGSPVSSEITTEFRTRVMELHQVLRQAIVEAGASLTVTYSSGSPAARSASRFQQKRRATLEVRDTNALSGTDVTVELELENGKCVDLSYPRDNLRSIPSDVLAWALLRDLDGALNRSH